MHVVHGVPETNAPGHAGQLVIKSNGIAYNDHIPSIRVACIPRTFTNEKHIRSI